MHPETLLAVQNDEDLNICGTCKRRHVDPMSLNTSPADRSMCYRDATGGDRRCKPPRQAKKAAQTIITKEITK